MSSIVIYNLLLSMLFINGPVILKNSSSYDIISKIELSIVDDLPLSKRINTNISIHQKKDKTITMELVYKIRSEWDKPYHIDKTVCCKIINIKDYENLWISLQKEQVFSLKELTFGDAQDALLFSDFPSFSAPTINFYFFDGIEENRYTCKDIKVIIGDRRYMAVFNLIKMFINKYHCDKTLPYWLKK